MPEFTAPMLSKFDNTVSMEVDVPANAEGALYALAGFSAGLTTYIKDGVPSYEYNLFEIQCTQIKSKEKLPAGKSKIEVVSLVMSAIAHPWNRPYVPPGFEPTARRTGSP